MSSDGQQQYTGRTNTNVRKLLDELQEQRREIESELRTIVTEGHRSSVAHQEGLVGDGKEFDSSSACVLVHSQLLPRILRNLDQLDANGANLRQALDNAKPRMRSQEDAISIARLRIDDPNLHDIGASEDHNMHPLVEEYFSVCGDLNNQEMYYKEEMEIDFAERRHKWQESGETLEQERQKLLADIQELRSRKKDLKGQCDELRLSIDPEQYQRNHSARSIDSGEDSRVDGRGFMPMSRVQAWRTSLPSFQSLVSVGPACSSESSLPAG